MPWLRPNVIALLVFAGSAVTSFGLWQHERHNATLDHRASLDFSLRGVSSSIEQQVASYQQVLRGVQGFIATSDRFTDQGLQAYVEAQQLGADFAGLHRISVARPVARPGHPDPYADPALRAVMDAARDSGHLTMTGRLKSPLVAADGRAADILMFLPWYQGMQQPGNLAERRAGLQGWVMASLHVGELMASLYGQHSLVSDVRVHDGVQLSDETLLFESAPAADAATDSTEELTEFLVLAGRTWAVTVRSRADSALSAGKDRSTLIAVVGAAFTLMLTTLAWVLMTARARAIVTAKEMTSELREIKERLELVFTASPDAMLLSRRVDGVVVDANNRFAQLAGVEREDLIGRPAVNIGHWTDPAARQKYLDEVKAKGVCNNLEASLILKDGTERVSLLSAKQILIRGVPHVITIMRDISERKEIELRMTHMAQHDSLTGLPNRALFYDRLQQELIHAKRDRTRLALMFLDLDDFKRINDTLGHATGDLLLKEVAARMLGCMRESDTVGRIGGDEFVILLPVIKDNDDALLVANKVRDTIAKPFTFPGGCTVCISCSTGIATFPEHGADVMELSRNADSAMYLAKNLGGSRVEFLNPL